MDQRILIIDYGVGNLQSVFTKLVQLSGRVQVTNDCTLIAKADKIVLPGVGHFATAMKHIASLSLTDALNEYALVKKKPLLGICLGMEIMADASEEAPGVSGLGWINGMITKLTVRDDKRYKVPHTGWQTVNPVRENKLFDGIPKNAEYYFSHAYHYSLANAANELATSNYESDFISAVNDENIYGVQFHPEKSYGAGDRLLINFLNL